MEYFDILDENGNLTGTKKERSKVHQDGDWHRAVHIWIINDKNELLLQRRSPNKDSHPNMWDISSAGHLSAGDESLTGAMREISEELGINVQAEQLEYLFTLKSASRYTETFINNEFDDIYLICLNLDLSQIQVQEDEISEVKFVYYKDLEQMVKNKAEGLLIHQEEYERLFEILHQRLDEK